MNPFAVLMFFDARALATLAGWLCGAVRRAYRPLARFFAAAFLSPAPNGENVKNFISTCERPQ